MPKKRYLGAGRRYQPLCWCGADLPSASAFLDALAIADAHWLDDHMLDPEALPSIVMDTLALPGENAVWAHTGKVLAIKV